MSVVYRIPQRWVDLDAQGHVNNAAVLDYLQEARVGLLRDSPNVHLLGNGLLVASHQVEYVRPISYGPEPLEVAIRVGDVGAARVTVAYEVYELGRLAVRARTVLCQYDFDTGRPTRLGASERAWFVSVAEPLEPLRDVGTWRVGPAAHEHPISVRWSDIDRYGHVNNTIYYDYVAEARVALYGDLLPDAIRATMAARAARTWMLVRQDLTHTDQMTYERGPYLVRTAVGAQGRTSSTLAAAIVDATSGRVAARSTSVVVHGDADGRPAPLPDELRAAGARWPAVAS